MNLPCFLLAVICSTSILNGAEMVKVQIVDRHDSEQGYSYTIPQSITSTSSTDVSCIAYPNSANCAATTQTTGVATPPRNIAYSVRGATYSLRLKDGKIVIVNCESKYMPRGDHINRRSCRTPIVDEIEVEFNNDKAKLF